MKKQHQQFFRALRELLKEHKAHIYIGCHKELMIQVGDGAATNEAQYYNMGWDNGLDWNTETITQLKYIHHSISSSMEAEEK